jgi:hypothetical protein
MGKGVDIIFKNLVKHGKHRSLKSKDIREHLPTLRDCAQGQKIVVEFGTRAGVSTIGLLKGQPKRLISYDIEKHPLFDPELCGRIAFPETQFQFIEQDVLEADIPEETDILFIDTLHTYDQLIEELTMHAGNVNDMIIMHDTETFKHTNEDKLPRNGRGLWDAIQDFLVLERDSWEIHEHFSNNNGLTIMERID